MKTQKLYKIYKAVTKKSKKSLYPPVRKSYNILTFG